MEYVEIAKEWAVTPENFMTAIILALVPVVAFLAMIAMIAVGTVTAAGVIIYRGRRHEQMNHQLTQQSLLMGEHSDQDEMDVVDINA